MDEHNQQNDRCRLDNGQSDNNMNNNNDQTTPMDAIDSNNNNSNNITYNSDATPPSQQQQDQQDQVRPIPSTQDVHTREKLFDFIALLQGRRMDDQRAILKPSTSTTTTG